MRSSTVEFFFLYWGGASRYTLYCVPDILSKVLLYATWKVSFSCILYIYSTSPTREDQLCIAMTPWVTPHSTRLATN